MTKTEIRANAKEIIVEHVLNAIPNLTKIDDYTYAICVGTAEDNGNPVYAKIDISAPNWYSTKTSPAFDLDDAVAKYEAKCEERAQKEAEREAKRAEKA